MELNVRLLIDFDSPFSLSTVESVGCGTDNISGATEKKNKFQLEYWEDL
jgi:hypothetical protein